MEQEVYGEVVTGKIVGVEEVPARSEEAEVLRETGVVQGTNTSSGPAPTNESLRDWVNNTMQGEQYQAEGSMPVAEGTVVPGEPVMVPGTVVQAPGAQQQPMMMAGPPQPMIYGQPETYYEQPPQASKVMPMPLHGQLMVPPVTAPRDWSGGQPCGWCDPPGGCGLCAATYFCPCVPVAQLHDRVVRPGSYGVVCGILGAATVLKVVVSGFLMPFLSVFIDPLLHLLLALLYLGYVNAIRSAIVARDGIADRGLICGDPCCENYWCMLCMTCFFVRHELNRSGGNYDNCCSPSWSRGGGAHAV
jgi:hypothetical protein